MSVDLSSLEETRSFLVPAYEARGSHGIAPIALDRRQLVGPVVHSLDQETYASLQREHLRYLTLGTANFLFGAAALYNHSVCTARKPFRIPLQEKTDDKPDGVVSTCLMIEGERLCPKKRHGQGEDLIPAYAAWSSPPRQRFTWVSSLTSDRSGDMRGKLVNAHWCGYGALCAYEPDGSVRLLLIDFRIFDVDTSRPDVLVVYPACQILAKGARPLLGPNDRPIDEIWRELIERALRGLSRMRGP